MVCRVLVSALRMGVRRGRRLFARVFLWPNEHGALRSTCWFAPSAAPSVQPALQPIRRRSTGRARRVATASRAPRVHNEHTTRACDLV